MSVVIDSSITLAWLFEDERNDAVDAVLRHVAEHGAIVPSLWKLEVANALQTAIRRRRIDEAFRDAALGNLAALDIAIDDETDRVAWSTTVLLAQRHGLTTYDAAYLELARRRHLPIATLDQELIQASSSEHLVLFA